MVGTGRCGTKYTSAVLNRAGLACGHEQIFTPYGLRRSFTFIADVSWLAVPHLGWFRGPVYHQVRDPIEVINSLLAIGFFSTDPAHPFARRPHRVFAERLFGLSGDQVADAVRWYVEWNDPCERLAELRFPIEEPDEGIRAIVHRHRPRSDRRVREALAVPDDDRNQKPEKKAAIGGVDPITATDLPDGPMTERLVAMARRYGYTTFD